MRLTSKYGIGDKVWGVHIWQGRKEIVCPECEGGGTLKIEGRDKYIECINCWKRGKVITEDPDQYYIARPLTIGSIEAFFGKLLIVKYMCDETGVGSGTVWKQENLFLSEEEAVTYAATFKAKRQALKGGPYENS